MKIKISESQLKKVLSEIGGYDDKEVMAMHGGNVHGEIVRIVAQTAELIEHFISEIKKGELTKENLMAAVFNISQKLEDDIKILNGLSSEIYLEDEFKTILRAYTNTLIKVLRYFRLLSSVGLGRVGGSPTSFTTGLGVGMSQSELTLSIVEQLSKIGRHLDKLGDMFNQVRVRFGRRMQSDHDDDINSY